MMTRRGRRERPAPSSVRRGKRERRRIELLGGVAIGVFSMLIVGVFALSGAQRLVLSSPQAAAVISAILVDLANGDRVSNGLPLLDMSPALVAAAQAKANDMAAKSYFSHVSPEGLDPWHWFEEAGYAFAYAGENLAIDFSDSTDVERAWMNSQTHRENILGAHYTQIGIATAQGMYEGRPTTFVVQEFGTPAEAQQIIRETIPPEPTKLAVAEASAAISNAQVLGSAQESQPPESTRVNTGATIDPALAASLSQSVNGNVPWWGYLLGYPRETLRYAYYVIGILVLLALVIETGLELRWHHRRNFAVALCLLIFMSGLFVVADHAIFKEPVLADTSSRGSVAT